MWVRGFTLLMTVPLESGVRNTVDLERKERWMRVLYKAMKVVGGHLQKFELRWFLAKTRKLVQWNCATTGVVLL